MTYNLKFFDQFKEPGINFQMNDQQVYTFPNGYQASVVRPFLQHELLEMYEHEKRFDERELCVMRDYKVDDEALKGIGEEYGSVKIYNDDRLTEMLNKIFNLRTNIEKAEMDKRAKQFADHGRQLNEFRIGDHVKDNAGCYQIIDDVYDDLIYNDHFEVMGKKENINLVQTVEELKRGENNGKI